MRNGLIAAGLAVMLAGLVTPAWAEHNAPPSKSVDLDVDLRVHRDGFRLGGHLLGLSQAYSGWLNGEVRPEGLTLDGRIQEGDRAFNFKFNAEMARWLLRALGGSPI
jgi:hypothetical protein